MEPVVPERPSRPGAGHSENLGAAFGWFGARFEEPGATFEQAEPMFGETGGFRQGSDVSRWALARYLVGRALGQSISRSLLILAVLILAVAALIGWGLGSPFWAVVVAIVAVAVLAMRAVLRAVLRRLTASDGADALAGRLRALVSDTRSDVLRELRRIGLPGRTWTLPLLVLRFLGRKRRRDTVARLRTFDLDRVVPPARVDELHLVLRARGSSNRTY